MTEATEYAKEFKKWNKSIVKERRFIPQGETIPEVFLNVCKEMKSAVCCRDNRAGILTYSDMQLRVILLADYIRTLPGDYIGILLPSSVAAYATILAVQLAGKIPLLINWTMGPRHLESVLQLSKVQVVLTSKVFLNRIQNVDLNGLHGLFHMLEDVREGFTFIDKLKAIWRSKRSVSTILETFSVDKKSKNNPAVLLFTSGTESQPKGVILSHENVLTNQKDAVQIIPIYSDDVFLGILPPFHAFGFTATGLFPLLAGIRTDYFPDPIDGRNIARECEKWQVTLICAAPTFLKGILKAAKTEQIKSLRFCISGAEKATSDLWQLFETHGKKDILTESYGITECGPALTVNRPGVAKKLGVGQALPSVELLIVHPETFQPIAIGKPGMILVRGSNIFAGYLNPDIKSPFIEVEGKQWYMTGDIGYLDADGFLTISGRLKRFIKIGGEMISLSAIEEALQKAAIEKGWSTQVKEGPQLAICAKEIEGEKPKIILLARFFVEGDEVNRVLRELGFSNLVKITSVLQVPEIPQLGAGKIHYRQLESQYIDKIVP